MTSTPSHHEGPRPASRANAGQIMAVFAIMLVAIVSMLALILEGGNAYAQQRVVQNAADATAQAGTVILAGNLAGSTRTDADVAAEVTAVGLANRLDSHVGYYTDVSGQFLSAAGAVVPTTVGAATVGGGAIPTGAQGVHLQGTRAFSTSFARVMGINSFNASADATAVTGRLTGGSFLPVVFPINIVDCEVNGDLGTGEANWTLSQPDGPDAGLEPDGQEFIVPLCKTGGGSFQILDLDPSLKCGEEASQGVRVNWPVLPVDVASDNGNNCAKPIADEVMANLRGETVLIPICEVDCVTTGGSKAFYTIVKIAAFYIDYMSDQNGGKNTMCQGNGGSLVPIAGNGSSSCLAGWFVRYISAGPVGGGPVGNSDAIGIQLIK